MSLAAKPLRYLIELDSDPGVAGSVTVIAYGADSLPIDGAGYINCRVEDGGRRDGVMYLPEDDIERDYGEPAIVFETLSFWENFDPQVRKWKALGAKYVEIDNLDTYNVAAALKMFDKVRAADMGVLVKNAAIVAGDHKQLLSHPAAAMVIVERDCGTPAAYDALRKATGYVEMPIRFVAYGDGKQWAQQVAQQIKAASYADMAVTFSPSGEYGSVEHILLPTTSSPASSTPMAATAPWLTAVRGSIGKYRDGPDVPALAKEVAQAFPDVPGLANYCALARIDTAWCGIFVAAILARYGIRPPFDRTNELRSFMWVDAWLDWGTKVTVGQQQPGDLALWLDSPHHISFVAGNGKYIGGNQSNAVTEGTYGTPDAIRRPPDASAIVIDLPNPLTDRFKVCLPRVLVHEGGNDDDPRDPGGRTSRGITAERWAEWRQTHPGLPADVWQAPQAVVEAIYREKYWDVMECDKLPVGVDYAVFDFGVNSGPARSAKFLQEIVGADVDGEIGPETLGKTRDANPSSVINELCDDRMAFLRGLSTWGTFGRGWTNRVTGVRAAALADAKGTPAPIPQPEPQPSEPMSELDKYLADAEANFNAALASVREAAKQQQQVILPPAVVGSMDITGLLDKVPDQIVTMLWPRIQALSADEIIDLKRRASAGNIGMLDLLGILKLSFSDMLTLGAMFGGMFASGGFSAPTSNLPATYQPSNGGGGLWSLLAAILPKGRA